MGKVTVGTKVRVSSGHEGVVEEACDGQLDGHVVVRLQSGHVHCGPGDFKAIGLDPRLDARLTHWLTEHDRRESNKKGYNRHALAQYFRALREEVEPALLAGRGLPDALRKGFIFPSRLLTTVARGLAKDGLLGLADLEGLVPK